MKSPLSNTPTNPGTLTTRGHGGEMQIPSIFLSAVFVSLILFLAGLNATFANIGDSEDKCIQRYGDPFGSKAPTYPSEKNIDFLDCKMLKGFYVKVDFWNGFSCREVYSKNDGDFSDNDITIILNAHTDGFTWKKGTKDLWERSDGIVIAVAHGSSGERQLGISTKVFAAFSCLDDTKNAATKGNAEAQFYLGLCYYSGAGVTKNHAEAVKWFRKAAEQGHAIAQYNLGLCYANATGVTEDLAEAVKWYLKSAEQGYARAQDGLGVCYYSGAGVTKDLAEAVKWYRKAAEQGNEQAVAALKELRLNPSQASLTPGSTKNYSKLPFDEVRKAAEQGNAEAQFYLGFYYEQGVGVGVTKDLAEAAKWYRKAAEQGHAIAQYNLGVFYAQGAGVTKDLAEAVKWFRKAAEQGYARAQDNLGVCYYSGAGVTKDLAEAVKWIRKAAEQGDAKAVSELELIRKQK